MRIDLWRIPRTVVIVPVRLEAYPQRPVVGVGPLQSIMGQTVRARFVAPFRVHGIMITGGPDADADADAAPDTDVDADAAPDTDTEAAPDMDTEADAARGVKEPYNLRQNK